MKRLAIHEILDTAAAMTNRKDKVKYLKDNESKALKSVLKAMYDKNLVSLLPEGAPPYETSPDADKMWLISKIDRIKFFYKGAGYDHVKPGKREEIFINFLGEVVPGDAEILIKMKDKEKLPNLTAKMINEAFPTLNITE